MFEIIDNKIIKQNEEFYLSFPDIIISRKNLRKIFIIFRVGDEHHPTYSFLCLMVSEDNGKTWKEILTIDRSLSFHGCVWNCPRLSYFPDGQLYIICDTKTGRNERTCSFNILFLRINEETYEIENINKTQMTGMLPDRIITFKNELYCANHIRDSYHKVLIELINKSKDKGKTWYDCSIIARDNKKYNRQYCEASIINYQNKYLMAYLRDNSDHIRPIYKYMSHDGIRWEPKGKLPIYGQRIVCNLYKNRLFATYRNTKDTKISILTCILDNKGKEKQIETFDIDNELKINLYHCGYTGLVKNNKNEFFVVYYIKQGEKNPFIKMAKLKWKK